MNMKSIPLSPQSVAEIDHMIDAILAGAPTIDVEEFMSTAHLWSDELPRELRTVFYDFKLAELEVALCVQGFPVDDAAIGPTPTQLRNQSGPYQVNRPDILHILFALRLGEPIGWSSQQAGHLLNDIVPVREREDTISGSGSSQMFDLHTEDAFSPYAADFLGLMCLRNPDRVPTILSSIADFHLDEKVKRTLFDPRFYVRVNFAQAVEQPKDKVPVLFGHQDAPYMRINLNNQYAPPDDEEAVRALRVLDDELTKHRVDTALQPGDFLYFDNFRVAHGRPVYKPRYDGTDRWLKRLTITSYLRKSRDIRALASSRVLAPVDARA